eukprot:TRINITY_DN422_c0_g2_i1.p1 TRINITY_DN422_c0_g2~~TRINITY_DN422_c0_g2_i1.p1  ORF type:complete len:380 (+),score=112.00 TRINITY_DN422_c0_g2_i1:1362-2501(+)
MTERFQKTVQALEEESQAEKRQLQAMHQQRVISRINQKKKLSMNCYTNALNQNPPNTHKVQKCLQKLLRALHKDRHHTIQHFRHLLETSFEQAEREREITIEHLADIDRLINESLEMLSRYEDLNTKILPLMEDYLIALRSRDNTPASLLRMDKQHEKEMIDNYTTDIHDRIKERERERFVEKRQRNEQRKESSTPELGSHVEAKEGKEEEKEKQEEGEGISTSMTSTQQPGRSTTSPPATHSARQGKELKIEVHATAIHHNNNNNNVNNKNNPQEQIQPKVAHSKLHDISHQASYSVRRVEMKENSSVYMTLAFAGIALVAAMVMGVVIIKKRSGRSPHHQGFVEVDQAASPEERHVANMQINGYENPTYKYFEASCT